MAVYTHISAEDVEQHLTRFSIGDLKTLAGITSGVENSNYLLETTKGKYVLTIFERRTNGDDLPFVFDFMTHVSQRDIPVPVLITDKQGERIHVIQGKACVLASFLEGEPAILPSVAQCVEMGKTLARLHLAVSDFLPTRANGMGLKEWKRLISLCAEKSKKGLVDTLRNELSFLAAHMPQDLPKGAVHADLFPDNVFFREGKISGVIDFYFSCTEIFAYDLMLTLNAWCFDTHGVLDQEKSSAFLNAYTQARPLSQKEQASLSILGRAAAVRIIATRLYDLLHPRLDAVVTAKDPMEYLRILHFHQRKDLI